MMKKLIALIALVAAPAALAAAQPKTVSINALPDVVTYGSPTTLTGNVTPAQAVDVHVASTLCLNAPTRVAQSSPLSFKSKSDGSWSTLVAPQVRTSYQATAKGAQSETVMVQVRPRVTLVRLSRHMFRTRAFAAKSFAGRNVLFQKRTAVGWTTVKRVTMHYVSSSTETVVSGRTFHSGVSVHKTVRILLPQIVAGNCYAPGISNILRG
jgi:hypothetical protein